MNYYICAYGNQMRISEKCESATLAANYCFGVVTNVTCLNIGKRSWRYATNKQKQEWQNKLASLHKENTGYKIGG